MQSIATDANLFCIVCPIVHFQRQKRWARIRKRDKYNRRNDSIRRHMADSDNSAHRNNSFMMAKKFATTGSTTIANTPIATGRMFVRDAEVPHHNTDVPRVLQVMSPINVNALYEGLATHPYKQFVDTIIDHALYGAPMGYSGPRNHRIHKNWPSAYKHREAVESIISRGISRGRKLGPYSHPPLINFVGSPMGAFERSTTGKHRVIYDLSKLAGHQHIL